jgi:hypothetical protein
VSTRSRVELKFPTYDEYPDRLVVPTEAIKIQTRRVTVALEVPLVSRAGRDLDVYRTELPVDVPWGADEETIVATRSISVTGGEYPIELVLPTHESYGERVAYRHRPVTVEPQHTEELELVRDDGGKAKAMLRHSYPREPVSSVGS